MDTNSFYETYINAGPSDLASRGYILQETVRQHPWFSLARLLLFKSLCGLGGEAYLSESERTAAYVYSRSQLFNILEEAKKQQLALGDEEFFTLDLTQDIEKDETPATEQEPVSTHMDPLKEIVLEDTQPRVFMVGADYFGKAEMDTVSLDVSAPIDRFISEKPRFTQVLRRTGDDVDTREQETPPTLVDDEFVTETLARIYAEQGYYKLAIACYSKLILLYPKKSAYFAALAQEIKLKINQ